MQVRDRRKLATLMVIQDVSHRALADAAGWSSHTYVGRLLRGEVNTLKPEPAVRIAKMLGVPVEDLFLTQMDMNSAQIGRAKRTRSRRSGEGSAA